jgi:hypothetical protein
VQNQKKNWGIFFAAGEQFGLLQCSTEKKPGVERMLGTFFQARDRFEGE